VAVQHVCRAAVRFSLVPPAGEGPAHKEELAKLALTFRDLERRVERLERSERIALETI